VFGAVHLDRPVLRSHAGFTAVIAAEGIDPPRALVVRQSRPIGSSVFFEILLPLDLTGAVHVTAVTNDPSRARSTEFYVGGSVGLGLGCGGLLEAQYYEPIRVGCEAIDCGWTGLNDLAELIGRSGGSAVRYLTSRRVIDPVGRLAGDRAVLRAINNRGTVTGMVDDGKGKVNGFIYGEPFADTGTAPLMHWMPGVSFHALNDAGVAVGGLSNGDRAVAVRWVKGRLEEIKVPSAYAIAMAVDGAGNVAGVHVPEGRGLVRGFVVDDLGFHDLGELGGNVVTLAMNGAGAVAGTVISAQAVRGFVYSRKTGLFDLKPPVDSGQCAVSGINDARTVVGTFWGDGDGTPRAFRYTTDRGSEDLNTLVHRDRMVVAEAAIAVNNLGQVLTLGRQNGEPGYFLLNPASIPTPQLPIP